MGWIFVVKCPHCGGVQKTRSKKVKTCVYCGKSFKVRGERVDRIVKYLKI